MKKTFTSESVCSGHPDKVCDQISDAILDAVLRQDPRGRVAVETLVTTDRVVLAGEVTTTASVDFAAVAQEQIHRLGYTDPRFHFTHTSPVDVFIHAQSPEIAVGVDHEGAGDQGMMFGFACREAAEYMPLPVVLAHRLAARVDSVREEKVVDYLRPDGKTQVTVQYEHGVPKAVTHVVVAVPHDEGVTLEQVKKDVYDNVVVGVLAEYGVGIDISQLIVNGTGVWYIGGPASDTGLTGRKIVVDTYGGYARVGGGCFSGKDPTKVDRSGAYAARYIAKNIVAAGLAERVEVGLAYVIGIRKPLWEEIETFGTVTVSDRALKDFVTKLLDTSVQGILNGLNLRRPLYLPTAAYGHFGRAGFPWEEIRKF
jgi:S-adenosylmethionine synthetase